MITHNPFKKQIATAVAAVLPAGQEPSLADVVYDLLTEPPDEALGHYALPCFSLARSLRRPPTQIAVDLASRLQGKLDATPAGPYVNFRFTPRELGTGVLAPMLDGTTFQGPFVENRPRTMIEFSQPNTHKELHVGHMRNLALGCALVNLYRYCGIPTIAATFPGDVGTHVARCLWYLRRFNTDPIPQSGQGEWLGRIYTLAVRKIEDAGQGGEADEYAREIGEVLRGISSGSGPWYELWAETRAWSVDLMHRLYDWAGVKFDVWFWESEVDGPSTAYVQELLAEGKLQQSQGAVGMDLSAEGLGFCLLLKSDGNGLYATKDLELARRKFQNHAIARSLYVVDVGQSLHLSQVFATLKHLGFEHARDSIHLPYEVVELPEGRMSSRKGNIVPITRLVQRMERVVRCLHLRQHEAAWSPAEIASVASQVARGAIKFGMLRVTNERKIVFQMRDWLRLDGDSGPYIQFAHARIASLLRRHPLPPDAAHPWELLVAPEEVSLAVILSRFNDVVTAACTEHQPALLCHYLIRVARSFSSFYTECPILTAGNPGLLGARLALAAATGWALRQGLNLLGMDAPERM